MNRLIQYGSVEAIPYYNCSWKSFEEWEKTGAKRPYMGYPLIFVGIFIECLYIPVLYIIFKTNLIKHACYKIIVVLITIDMSATFCSCIITGSLLVAGSVFCMYPTFTYVTGGIALCAWCMACAATVSLFANRIISIAFREYADMIEKKLAYSSIVFIFSYGFYIYFFTPVCCYNSVIMAWIANPLSEKVPSPESDKMYENPVQSWNNWIFLSCIFSLFAVYISIVKKLAQGQKSKASRSIFIQCSIICFFNSGVALVYNALVYVTPSPWILVFAQICWVSNHACPAIIYVTMNNTIRREFKRMVFGCISHKVEDTSTANKTASQSRI